MMRSRLVVLGLWVLMGPAAPLSGANLQASLRTASVGESVTGDWVDRPQIEAGGLGIALHFRRKGDVLAGTIDVPQLGGMGAPLINLKADNSHLSFDLPGVSAHYSGLWDPTKEAYVGTIKSPGGNGSFTFVRGTLPPPKAVDWSAPMAHGFDYVPVRAAQARIGITLPIGKCINISNTLEAPREGAWGSVVSDDDLAIIKAAGFRTIRVPVRWSAHAEEIAPYTIDPAFLARVHHVVGRATASGLNVILNVHDFDGLDSAPEANAVRFAAIWRQIAASFADAPGNVWFELDNEPHDKFTNANLLAVFEPALAAIRQTNKTRPVLIGGEGWSGIRSLATLPMPNDPNVVPTFHYYDPFAFTHQGATWLGPHAPPMGRAYGLAADKVLLDQDLQKAKDYMVRTGRVPVLGEFGAQDDARVPLEQRIRYYRTISAAFASIGIQSCAWGYRSGFRLRAGDHWLPGMVESISTTTP